ncbi:MAG TPA: S1C family serine protease [Lacipirellulaceae bacterium]|nr:S1C family serine protease [Lacipirellulaceae bacterium]
MVRDAQRKVVKIYGAGGLRQLEAYQTGILVSPQGEILTVLSYVLDTDDLAVVLDDGRRFKAQIAAMDPVSELALLRITAAGEALPAFDLSLAAEATAGQRVLALSNLYNIAGGDEPVSVLQGVVSAIAPLDARRGSFATGAARPVYVLDAAANNPGAAGGALIDWNGQLLGLLGKELRSRVTGAWLHYALPAAEVFPSLQRMRLGQAGDEDARPAAPADPLTLADLGLVLVPDVLLRTPPYVDRVIPASPAARAGLRADDLVVLVAGEPAASCKAVVETVGRLERFEEVLIAVLRGGEFIEVTLSTNGGDGDDR